MDPQLREELSEAAPEEELELLVRLRPGPPPRGLRIVTRFGDVATVRIRARDVAEVYEDPAIISMKAARGVTFDERVAGGTRLQPRRGGSGPAEEVIAPSDRRRPPGLPETGRGVVVGVIDWGCDITHPDLRRADGRTRLLALWDQGGSGTSPRPWGYGRHHDRAAIDRALATADPFATLGYDMGSPAAGPGAHGTHVAGIAVGNGRGRGPLGLAPAAELVFVHLAGTTSRGLANLGNSVRLLEALDFVYRIAGERPCVVNLSVGAHGGPHDGTTLLERGFDAALAGRPGRALCQSTGNYYDQRIHTTRRLTTGQRWRVPWDVSSGDPTDNELELWYPGSDRLVVTIRTPAGDALARVPLGHDAPLRIGTLTVGHLYHRRRDPNNGDHLVDVFLRPSAPAGRWTFDIEAVEVRDGRCHLWIERDRHAPAAAQSRFPVEIAVPTTTTGTIANGRLPLTVGAYDPHTPDAPIGRFSSAGPTRDGRAKPDLLAPGVRSLAASSRWRTTGRVYERKNGTSMAAPVVTGTVALLFEAAGPTLTMPEIRRIVLGTSRRVSDDTPERAGRGRLDVARAVAAARRHRRSATSGRSGPAGGGRWEGAMRLPATRVSAGEAEHATETIPTRPVPRPPALDAWRGLLAFVPPPAAAARGSADVFGIRPQPIERAYGPVNLDLYTVIVSRLPPGSSAPALLERVRRDLNRFVDTTLCRFAPANAAAGVRWHSTAPLGSVVHIDMYARGVNLDDGSVLCAQAAADNWVFSTIWTPMDLGHPVSGNRMFGIVRRGTDHVLFTMGADRLTSVLDLVGEHATGLAFLSADRLWRSFQHGVVRDVTAAGGSARVGPVHSVRYPWDDIRRLYGGPPVTAIRPILP